MSSLTNSKKSKINKNYYLYIITQYQPTLCSPSVLYNDIKHGGIEKAGDVFSSFLLPAAREHLQRLKNETGKLLKDGCDVRTNVTLSCRFTFF